jgi:hypothetical protein
MEVKPDLGLMYVLGNVLCHIVYKMDTLRRIAMNVLISQPTFYIEFEFLL